MFGGLLCRTDLHTQHSCEMLSRENINFCCCVVEIFNYIVCLIQQKFQPNYCPNKLGHLSYSVLGMLWYILME